MAKLSSESDEHTVRDRDCSACKAACCSHIAIAIDRPKSKQEYGHVRWYLSHENVTVYIDHNDIWNVEFNTPCRHLDPAGLCGIYETRPIICREYPADDQYCVYETTQPPYAIRFCSEKEFEDWLDGKGLNWRPKIKKTKGAVL